MTSALRLGWHQTGEQLGRRYAENVEAYAAAGFPSPQAYRRDFVKSAWPHVGEHVKRAIREGFAVGFEARAAELAKREAFDARLARGDWETGELAGQVVCFECGDAHVAEFSHDGRFDEGPIFAVVCTVDGLTSYYTTEVLTP